MLNVDFDTPLTGQDLDSTLNSVAKAVVDRRLEAPVVLFLEMHKPLSFLASQAMLVSMPLLAPLIGFQRMADMSKILADRANIDMLIDRIEELASAEESGEVQ